MSYFITIGKCLMLLIWVLLLANLFSFFPEKAAGYFDFFLLFLCTTHLIQLLMIYRFFGEKLRLTKKEASTIFLFGVFKLWQIKDRLN
jgi:putative membrane protein